MKVYHTLKPIYSQNSKILILGSIPSIVSRKNNFYYANATNRFWAVMENIFKTTLITEKEKIDFLLKNNIALWDIIYSCEIKSSSDSSIKNVEVNDIKSLIDNSKIKYIFCTGKKSFDVFTKYFDYNNVFYLPSTSSANARYNLKALIKKYKKIKYCLEK